MQRSQKKSKNIMFLSILGAIVVIVVGAFILYSRAKSPMVTAEKEAVTIAKKYANLDKESEFYRYNRDATYFTVAGTTKANKKIYVIVAQKGGKVKVLTQANGKSKNDILTYIWDKKNPSKILNIGLGIYNDVPAWEVSYLNKKKELSYETIQFSDGKVMKSVENI